MEVVGLTALSCRSLRFGLISRQVVASFLISPARAIWPLLGDLTLSNSCLSMIQDPKPLHISPFQLLR